MHVKQRATFSLRKKNHFSKIKEKHSRSRLWNERWPIRSYWLVENEAPAGEKKGQRPSLLGTFAHLFTLSPGNFCLERRTMNRSQHGSHKIEWLISSEIMRGNKEIFMSSKKKWRNIKNYLSHDGNKFFQVQLRFPRDYNYFLAHSIWWNGSFEDVKQCGAKKHRAGNYLEGKNLKNFMYSLPSSKLFTYEVHSAESKNCTSLYKFAISLERLEKVPVRTLASNLSHSFVSSFSPNSYISLSFALLL